MKFYKEGRVMNADKSQYEIVEEAGWSRTKPEPEKTKEPEEENTGESKKNPEEENTGVLADDMKDPEPVKIALKSKAKTVKIKTSKKRK